MKVSIAVVYPQSCPLRAVGSARDRLRTASWHDAYAIPPDVTVEKGYTSGLSALGHLSAGIPPKSIASAGTAVVQSWVPGHP